MSKRCFARTLVLCSAILVAGNSVAQLGFEEGPWDGVVTVNPIDTTRGVAIYAVGSEFADYSLPEWYASIWDSTPDSFSVPNYFRDVSFEKHGVFADPYGRDDTTCFVASPYWGTAVGDTGLILSTNNLETWGSRTSNTTDHLHGVSFSIPVGIAVGDSGAIVKTGNQGMTWASRPSPTASDLNAVFLAGGWGVAVGDSGTILWTLDYGDIWIEQGSGTACNLNGVSICGNWPQRAIAVGDSGIILRTEDAGQNWDTVASRTTNDLYGVNFPDAYTGFIVGDSGTILRTEDAGQNWDTPLSISPKTLRGVHFTDVDTGVVVGASGAVFRTKDGGQNWDTLSSQTTDDLYGVSFTDVKTGIVVGSAGTILRTEDGGESWDPCSTETTNDLYGVFVKKITVGIWGGGADFTWNILTKADSIIDFARYDSDGDQVVDMVFLIIPRFSGKSLASLRMPADSFATDDTSASGDTIFIWRENGTANLIVGGAGGAIGVVSHEYGHQLGLPDYYRFDDPVKGNGLGSFEPMNARGFYGRISPFNPWFRTNPFSWLEPVPVTSSMLDQPIQDITTGELYELVSDLGSEALMTGQRFLVSNHQQKSFWEEKWPAPGLMIWHAFDNPNNSLRDSRRKIVDLEVPHGLWDWAFYPSDTIYPDTAYILSPNPLYGLDSLDAAAVTWPPKYDGLGSATCIYRAGVDTIFDAFSNPSTDEYNIDLSAYPVSVQDIASHVAVRNIYLDIGDTTVMRADLIVNRVESDVTTATGENNARRWILGPDGETMHLVYVSKGYIYYTTTDSNKVWLPAIPIGQGSFPSLSLDTSGNPAVVWLEEGVCNVTPSKLLFSIKNSGSWSDPYTLLSVPEELGPPSFVIDSLDLGHLVYKVHFCDQNGSSAIHYGAIDTDAPSLQDTVLDASELSCGNASIGYTPYFNSVHVVWEKESKIWHSWKDLAGWHGPEDVSAELKDKSRTPSIDVVGDTVHVVWAFELDVKKEIIRYRRKYGVFWGSISSPSDTNLETSGQPVVTFGPGGLYAVWAEVPTGYSHSDIMYAKWSPMAREWVRLGNYSANPVTDDYPQALQRISGSNPVLDVVWTSGDLKPFHVANFAPDLRTRGVGGGQSAGLRNRLPKVFGLSHPFPTPFSQSVVLRYQVPRSARVILRVYDVTGRLVKNLVDGSQKPGRYAAEWGGADNSGRRVSHGVYFARMESGNFLATRKLVFLR